VLSGSLKLNEVNIYKIIIIYSLIKSMSC
jgi:hypothetical protein